MWGLFLWGRHSPALLPPGTRFFEQSRWSLLRAPGGTLCPSRAVPHAVTLERPPGASMQPEARARVRLCPVSLGTWPGSPSPPGAAHCCFLPRDQPWVLQAGVDALACSRAGHIPVTAVRHRGIWPHVKVGWPRASAAAGGQTRTAFPVSADPSGINKPIRGLILSWCWRVHTVLLLPPPVWEQWFCCFPSAAGTRVLCQPLHHHRLRPLRVGGSSSQQPCTAAGERVHGDPRQVWAPTSPSRTWGAAAQAQIRGGC